MWHAVAGTPNEDWSSIRINARGITAHSAYIFLDAAKETENLSTAGSNGTICDSVLLIVPLVNPAPKLPVYSFVVSPPLQ